MIGNKAFYGCKALTGIKIPKSVTTIERCVFDDCDNLTIYCEIEESEKPYGWVDGWNCSRPVVWGYKSFDDDSEDLTVQSDQKTAE
jgi:hypothetical protein